MTSARPESRHIQQSIEGLHNFRDLGGLRTANGARLRSGLIYRSANHVFLTADGGTNLVEGQGVQVRIDLRAADEIEETAPIEIVPGGLEVVNLPIVPKGEAPTSPNPLKRLADHYINFLNGSRDSMAAIVEHLVAAPHRPVVLHCSAGKDRTGVVAAVALDAVGIQRDEIALDYSRTGEHLDLVWEQLRGLESWTERLDALPVEQTRAEAQAMELFLHCVDEEFGGSREYLRSSGVPPATIDLLTTTLLSQPSGRLPTL